jgi:hypothetical protein
MDEGEEGGLPVSGMELESAFRTTCRVIFGEEIGSLKDFAPYFKELMMPYQMKKSCVSGKEVMVSNDFYPRDAKFASQDELPLLKFPPLNVNEMKDIDSLFEAASERAVYCGNKLFGTNRDVKEADNCVDCFNVMHAHNVYNVKYGAYISTLRESEYVFGMGGFPKSRMAIRTWEGVGANRCFEAYYGTNLSDMYYAMNCVGCSNCIFAFNLRSKRNVIGNLELPKDRFMALKKKLLAEMAGGLRKNKRLFSLADIAFYGREKKMVPEDVIEADGPVPSKVEGAWRATGKIVLGREHPGITKFGKWLSKRTAEVKRVRGANGTPTYKIGAIPIVGKLPADRLVTHDEGEEAANLHPISIGKGETPSLEEVLARVAKVARFSFEFIDGPHFNCVDTPNIYGGSNVYKIWDTTEGKDSAYSSAVIKSEHLFGGAYRLLLSQFCINIFDSTNLKGCFEVDCSYATRNSYFCHNCENVTDSMFCFNAKALQYAFCNQQVGKGEYLRLKKILLDYVNVQLGKKGALDASIFSIPAGKMKKQKG